MKVNFPTRQENKYRTKQIKKIKKRRRRKENRGD
jgi:hypothetical protein